MPQPVWWALVLLSPALFIVAEFIVVKVAVYAFYKARQLHEKDLERESRNGEE